MHRISETKLYIFVTLLDKTDPFAFVFFGEIYVRGDFEQTFCEAISRLSKDYAMQSLRVESAC